jgi:hypothetical protein
LPFFGGFTIPFQSLSTTFKTLRLKSTFAQRSARIHKATKARVLEPIQEQMQEPWTENALDKLIEEPTNRTSIPELARELLYLPFHLVVPSDTNPRPKGDVYEIIGGHRRYAALKELAQEHKTDKRFTRIAVVVVHADDALVPVMQLAENLNRADLSCVEVADGVARALKNGVDTTQLAENLGWSRRNLRRYMR